MILIIAVLALLAILATVYLVAARTERQSSLATDESVNFDFARTAVLSQLRARLYDDVLGGYTGTWLYVPRPWMPSDPAGHGPMLYVKFDPHDLESNTYLARRQAFEQQVVLGPDFRLYACVNTHQADFLTHGPPPGNTLDWKPLDSSNELAIGHPASRWYDYPERPLLNRWGTFGHSVDAQGTLSGTPDQPYLVKDILYARSDPTDLSFLTGTRFDPHTGQNDLPYTPLGGSSPGAGDTTAATVLDANWHMLPFASARGTRYRFAFRMRDTNGLANLNTGFLHNLNNVMDADGITTSSVRLDSPDLVTKDAPIALQQSRAGVIRYPEVHSPQEWQVRSYGWDHAGAAGFHATALVPAKFDWPLVRFFDFADELELRAYGGTGTGYQSRPEVAWPHTLAPVTLSQPNRDFFTTYSFDRQITIPFVPRFTLLDYPPILMGAPKPCDYSLAYIGFYTGAKPIGLRTGYDLHESFDFIQWTDLLVHLGYSDDEAISFALNGIYQATGDDSYAVVRDGPNYYLVHGRGRNGVPVWRWLFYTPECQIPWHKCPPPTSASPPSDVYLPYVAQPFLNELDVILQPPSAQNELPTALDCAVELLNPYTGGPVNIRGWRLRVGNDPWLVFGRGDVPAEVPAATDAENPGFLSVNLSRDADGFRGYSAHLHTVEKKGINPVGAPVYLERPYIDNNGQGQWMVVDQFAWPTPPPAMAPGGSTVTLSFQRNNQTTVATPTQPKVGAVDGWLAACPVTTLTLPEPSLDHPNNVPVGDPDLFGVYMPDRAIDTFGPVDHFETFFNRNVGQLQYIPRIGPRLTAAGPVTVPDQLADRSTLFTRGGRSYFPQEAKVRFDFLADGRAVELLRYLTTAGDDALDRIPGRINVNTAPPQVLFAVLQNITANDALARNFAAAIVAYRDRTRRSRIDDPVYRRNGPDYDFTNSALFPGRGIRSIAELAIPMNLITVTLTIDNSVSPPQLAPAKGQTLLTLHGTPYVHYASPWDMNAAPNAFFIPPPNVPVGESPEGVPHTHPGALWPRLFTQLTVRSDTFVVYGYMEALQIHPNVSIDPKASPYHDNAYNWYDFDEGGISLPQILTTVDDAGQTTRQDRALRNLRLVRRRFVAIIDRTFANTSRNDDHGPLPTVMAIKDLPPD